jgi:CRISPR-associated protein Cas2
MRVLLLYDIINDRQRSKVADACLDYGLDRIQYSAFSGLLSRTNQEALMLRVRAIIGNDPARVHLYPIDEKAWHKRLMLENGDIEDEWEEDDDVPRSADE